MASDTIQGIDVEQFRRDGFVVVRGVLDAAEIEAFGREVEHLEAACVADPPPADECFLQWDRDFNDDGEGSADQATLRMITPVIFLSAPFAELARDPRITGPVAQALRDEGVELFEDKLNCKLPGGAGFQWHQDWSCCWRPYTDQVVTCFVAIDASDRENGALQVIPGSHEPRVCLPFSGGEEQGFEVDPEHVDGERAVLVEMAPGDLLLFDSYLLHHSERNRSDHARRTIIFSYAPARLGHSYNMDGVIEKRRARLGDDAIPAWLTP